MTSLQVVNCTNTRHKPKPMQRPLSAQPHLPVQPPLSVEAPLPVQPALTVPPQTRTQRLCPLILLNFSSGWNGTEDVFLADRSSSGVAPTTIRPSTKTAIHHQEPIKGRRRPSRWPYLPSATATFCLRDDTRVSPGRRGCAGREVTATRVKPGIGDSPSMRGFLWPEDYQMALSFSLQMETSTDNTSRRTSVEVEHWSYRRAPLQNSRLASATWSNEKRRYPFAVAKKQRIGTETLLMMSSSDEGRLMSREEQGQEQGTCGLETDHLEAADGI